MPTITEYLTRTKQLLQNPGSAASKLFSDALLTDAINHSRSQIAGEGECVRNYATIPAATNARSLNFSAIALAAPTTGIAGVLNVRQALVQLGDGSSWMQPRPFPWFTFYRLNVIVPPTGLPAEWSQFGQGVTGSIYIDPLPDQDYVLNLDCVCYPEDLTDDADTEVLPYPWTDCVPFYAAYYAYLGAQRVADADKIYQRYEQYMTRARNMSNPDVVPQAYQQAPQDPSMMNRFGVAPKQGGG